MRAAAAAAALTFLLAGCGGDGKTAGGADDLPGPVPDGVVFKKPPGGVAAPPLSGELMDGTPVSGEDLWKDRPVVLVFTASWCEQCADVHRAVARVVDEQDGAVALLGIVPEDDRAPALEYAKKLDLGYPVAAADERTWLNYAAREPPVVILVGPGGTVLRGWPGGVAPETLSKRLEELIK